MLANHSSRTMTDSGGGSTVSGSGPGASPTAARDEFIVLQGTLKKLKTNKRRYFVLFREGHDQPSRLDYFENERKFRHKFAVPKRSIVLKSCFHIDQRRDTKHKFVISLYTKDDCFGLVMESDEDLRRWLRAMQELHSAQIAGDQTRKSFGEFLFVSFCCPTIRQRASGCAGVTRLFPPTVGVCGLLNHAVHFTYIRWAYIVFIFVHNIQENARSLLK